MAKVLLVQPHDDIRSQKRKLDAHTPLSLICVGTAIKDKHKVRIYDRNLNISDKDFFKLIGRYNPDIIGFSSMTSLMLIDLIHLANLIKKNFPKKLIVVGGIHATLEPDSLLNESYIDYVIRGEGEDAFLEFCNTFDKDKKNLKKLKNVNKNPLRPYIKMDDLILPDYNLVNLKAYEHFYVSISRGCPGNCTFCASSKTWGINGKPFVRSFNTEKSMKFFKQLIEKYKIKTFEIVDDNFVSFKSRAILISKYLKKFKINFWCFARVDYINEEVLNALRKAGCHTIQIGAESGSQRVLDFLNKNVKVEQNIQAILCCKRNNIFCDASFMIGLPTETKEEMNETISLIKKYQPEIANVKIYNPLPGAPLFDYCVKNNLIEKPKTLKEWALWTGNHRTVNHNVSSIKAKELSKISQELWKVHYYKTRIRKLLFWMRARNFSNIFHGIRKFVLGRGNLYAPE